VSQFAELRYDFNRRVATEGWTKPEDVQGTWPVPVERWLSRFYKPAHFELARPRRLANHFMIGADPEFIFMNAAGRVNADQLNFKAGLAYGADNNGRLVEIRPKPSRFALEVLASTWSTLKLMSLLEPNVLNYSWRAGAYYPDDGLGGHIHFGRKRPQRQREIAALDTLCYYLFYSGVYDREEGRQRIRNAQGGGAHGYGRLGDLREQPYGYEYRTFPSWLATPWMAYLSMVLAKLVVCDPSLLPPLEAGMEQLNELSFQRRLTALLAYYKGLDDDAQLALEILTRHGFPRWHIGDFKASWGILAGIAPPSVKVAVKPTAIIAANDELAMLAESLLEKRPPAFGTMTPNWPSSLPPGYIPMVDLVATRHAPGVGELASQLCVSTDGSARCAFEIAGQIQHHIGVCVQFDKQWPAVLENWKIKFPEEYRLFNFHNQDGAPWMFRLGKDQLAAENRQRMLELFTSGIFPIWRISEVKPESFPEWVKAQQARPKKRVTFEFSKELK
jgi:hypothetical protein